MNKDVVVKLGKLSGRSVLFGVHIATKAVDTGLDLTKDVLDTVNDMAGQMSGIKAPAIASKWGFKALKYPVHVVDALAKKGMKELS